MNIGIYRIISPTGRIYVGQSRDLNKRFNDYFSLKCKGQIKLYRSFIKYGVNNHIFEIIEICGIDELNINERKWQDFYRSVENGLNCIYQNTKDKPKIYSKEICLKISKSNKGKGLGRKLSKFQIDHLKLISKDRYNKLVLNLETGIYYDSAKKAADSANIKYSTFVEWLNNGRGYGNKSSFIYV